MRPRFLILGAQKSGTGALFAYLRMHPDIQAPKTKEISFFDTNIRYQRGEDWYHEQFPQASREGRITFEATPEYLYYPATVDRIFRYDPRIRLIVLLREPVSRAFSGWNMLRHLKMQAPGYLAALLPECDPPLREWFEQLLARDGFPDFDEAVKEEISAIRAGAAPLEPGYVQRGIYHEQLQRFFWRFDRRQVAIFESEHLKHDPRAVLRETVRFLELPPIDWQSLVLPPVNEGSYGGEISATTRALLAEFYRPHNERLFDLLGRCFAW